jgi:hypothetical protein
MSALYGHDGCQAPDVSKRPAEKFAEQEFAVQDGPGWCQAPGHGRWGAGLIAVQDGPGWCQAPDMAVGAPV